MLFRSVTPRAVDGYIQTLQKTKSVSTKTRKAVTTYVSDKTIEKIIKLLRCAFKQAVRWEIIARNPFDNVILPKTEYAKRDIWTADMIRLALDKCTDSKLYVAMNLSFACSLRMLSLIHIWELSFSDLPQMEMDKLCVVDHYPSDRFTFSSHGYDLHIENELVADAFAGLSVQEQSILILHFVLDLPDQEVGRLVGMSRSAVQRRRAKSLTELRIKLAALMPKGG